MSANEKPIESAEIVKTAEGRQYHLNLAPGEVAPYILVCGDPARAEKISQLFDEIKLSRSNREFLTYTGTYRGLPVSVIAAGIGCGNMEIVMIELLQCIEKPTIIRVGSSGSLQTQPALGDLIISTGAVRIENVSNFLVPEGYPALVHPEVQLALIQAARLLKHPFHSGLTATSPSFYGAQGRQVPGFPLRQPQLVEELTRIGVMNLEMESSILFTLAQLAQARAGMVCAVYAQRQENTFVTPEQKDKAERNCIQVGLTALQLLQQLDQKREQQNDPLWFPWLDTSQIENNLPSTVAAKDTRKIPREES